MGRASLGARAPDTPLGVDIPAFVDTVILVDVDGVLNVGAREEKGTHALLLNNDNVEHAFRLYQQGALQQKSGCDPAQKRSVERLVSIWQRKIPEEGNTTYASLACRAPSMISNVLVQRLARLVRLAGERTAVVLSSSWRKRSHASRVRHLEEAVSYHLGEPFTFDAATPMVEEHGAADRLQCIVDFVTDVCQSRMRGDCVNSRQLRVLALEDFFITAPSQWASPRCGVDSVEAAEKYISGHAPPGFDVTVKVIHTFDEWTSEPTGLRIALGAGLTERHVREASDFLQGGASPTWNWPRQLGGQAAAANAAGRRSSSFHTSGTLLPELPLSAAISGLADMASARCRSSPSSASSRGGNEKGRVIVSLGEMDAQTCAATATAVAAAPPNSTPMVSEEVDAAGGTPGWSALCWGAASQHRLWHLLAAWPWLANSSSSLKSAPPRPHVTADTAVRTVVCS